MFKNKVAIPPLLMQDDTLTISTCGFKIRKISEFINAGTNLMGLQFGQDKCVKMHVGMTYNPVKCADSLVDAWTETVVTDLRGNIELKDTHIGK